MADVTQETIQELSNDYEAYQSKKNVELLDEAFAYFFERDNLTAEHEFEEIKNSLRGWRDYYAQYVTKANQLLELLGESNESQDSSNS